MRAQRERPPAPARDGLLAYSVLSGAAATFAGAVASLAAEGSGARLLVWLVVTVAVACSAGIWWGRCPATAHRLVPGRMSRSGHR